MNTTQQAVVQRPYPDLPFRIGLSVLAAHFIIAFGIDHSFFELLLMKDYYYSLLISSVIAFILVSLVRLIAVRLDRRLSWFEQTFWRAIALVAGWVLISIVAFLLAALNFRLHGIDILDTVYIKYDYPVIVFFIFVVNLYYLCYYLVRYVRAKRKSEEAIKQSGGGFKTAIVVHRGTKNIRLDVDGITYFYHDADTNFARTKAGEDFLLTESLDEIQRQLDGRVFFRVNRKMIVHRRACQHFEPIEYNKLLLAVEPVFKEPVIVSQKRTRSFREWFGV